MTALVTGSSGFAGQHLVRHLTEAGHEVAGLDRADGVDITDAGSVLERLRAVRPDVVYHLAGFADVGASWDDPGGAFAANAVGTLNLLEAARDVGVARVLVVGSADVYGVVDESSLPLAEDQPVAPVSPYAASKLAAEHLAEQAWRGHGIDTIRIRAFNHLGPGQTPRFVAAALAERIARAELSGAGSIDVGNLTPRRDFTDVRDVVRAYRLFAERGTPGEVYHVCSGVDVSIGELAERMVSLAGDSLQLAVDPALQRAVDIPVLRGDRAKIGRDTGWEPEIPLDATLTALLDEARGRVAAA